MKDKDIIIEKNRVILKGDFSEILIFLLTVSTTFPGLTIAEFLKLSEFSNLF